MRNHWSSWWLEPLPNILVNWDSQKELRKKGKWKHHPVLFLGPKLHQLLWEPLSLLYGCFLWCRDHQGVPRASGLPGVFMVNKCLTNMLFWWFIIELFEIASTGNESYRHGTPEVPKSTGFQYRFPPHKDWLQEKIPKCTMLTYACCAVSATACWGSCRWWSVDIASGSA